MLRSDFSLENLMIHGIWLASYELHFKVTPVGHQWCQRWQMYKSAGKFCLLATAFCMKQTLDWLKKCMFLDQEVQGKNYPAGTLYVPWIIAEPLRTWQECSILRMSPLHRALSRIFRLPGVRLPVLVTIIRQNFLNK